MNAELQTLLNLVDWSNYLHAYGNAGDFPVLFEKYLASSDEEDDRWEMFNHINHQGSWYSVTPVAVDFFCKALKHVDARSRLELVEFVTECSADHPVDACNSDSRRDGVHIVSAIEALRRNQNHVRPFLPDCPHSLIFAAARLGFEWPEILQINPSDDLLVGLKHYYLKSKETSPPIPTDSATAKFFMIAELLEQSSWTGEELDLIWEGLCANNDLDRVRVLELFKMNLNERLDTNILLKTRVIERRIVNLPDFSVVSIMVHLCGYNSPSNLNAIVARAVRETEEFWISKNLHLTNSYQNLYPWFPRSRKDG